MKKMIFLLLVIVCSSIVLGEDIFRFSGTVDEDNNIGGIIDSCPNNFCNSWEDFSNCPEDCEAPIEPYLNVNLVDSKTDGVSDNTYDNGWYFVYDIDYYHPDANYLEFKVDDFINEFGDILLVDGNVIMEYVNEDSEDKVYDVKNDFQEPASDYVDKLFDESDDLGIQSTVTIKVKFPQDTPSGSYASSYEVGLFS